MRVALDPGSRFARPEMWDLDGGYMLVLKPGCECCDKDLPPEAADAMICTFECTFCRDCVDTRLHGVCPNCGGNFSPRPIRPAAMVVKYPPIAERTFHPEKCGRAA